MKPSDLQIILNGLEIVAKSFIKRNEAEIRRTWQNSSLNDISKSVTSSIEEKLSSAIATNSKDVAKIVTEAKERSFVIAESIRQYTAYVVKQKGVPTSLSNRDKNLDIDHPIIQQEMTIHDIKDQSSSIIDKSLNIPKIKPFNQQISQKHTNSAEFSISNSPSVALTEDFSKKTSIQGKQNTSNSQKLQFQESTTESNTFKSAPATVTEEFIEQNLIQAKPTINKSQKLQKLSDQARERKVPSSRIARLLSYGELAAGMGLGAVAEVTRRSLRLKTEKESDAFLTESPFLSKANANRIVDTLCKVRGAALKLGQMLSIQDNSMISPQFAAILERVRQSADFMPSWQMEKVLREEFGEDWRDKFLEFDSKPFAAASIGQVHCAKLLDGTDAAVKIQYPGVAQGIEKDINSLLSIVHLWNILPKGMYVDNVMAVAKRELKKEVNYINEAKSGKMFKELLKQYPEYYVPSVYENLCTSNVLTTELVYGTPIDKLQDSDQDLRNWVCEKLLKLCLMEIFLFRFMQTDPNWSNFFYNYDSNQIVLLDFGACNSYTHEFVDTYMNIIKAAAEQDRPNVLRFSQELGFLTGYETKIMEEAHVDAVMILGEAFACKKPFDFKQQNMTQRIHQLVPIMLKHRLTPPPEETYSLHRKMSGIFLLCTKLRATIDCSILFDDIYKAYISQKSSRIDF